MDRIGKNLTLTFWRLLIGPTLQKFSFCCQVCGDLLLVRSWKLSSISRLGFGSEGLAIRNWSLMCVWSVRALEFEFESASKCSSILR